MSSADTTTAERLSKALDCLLIERFVMRYQTLEKLLTDLSNSDGLLNTIPIEVHCKWFASVLDVCQQQAASSRNSSTHLYSFALKYLGVLVKCEDRFMALAKTGTLHSMIEPLNLRESLIFNSYMTLLQTLNTHKCGIEYVFNEGLWKNLLVAIHGSIVSATYFDILFSQYIADLIYKSYEYGITHYCETLLDALFLNLKSTGSLISYRQSKEWFTFDYYVKTLISTLEKFIGTKYESAVCEKIIYKYSLSSVLVDIEKLLKKASILLKNYKTLHLLYDCYTVWNYSDMESVLKSIVSHINTPKDVQSYKQINSLYIQAIRYASISNTHLAVNLEFEKKLIHSQLIPLKKFAEKHNFSTSEKSKFDDSCIIESKCILNHCNITDDVISKIAFSSLINILDCIPILKQDSLEYLETFFSTLTDRFLNSIDVLDFNPDSTYCDSLEIMSYVLMCWIKILNYKSYSKNDKPSPLIVPLVHSHSQFFHKVLINIALVQNGMKIICSALDNNIINHSIHTNDLTAFDKLCDTLNNFLLDERPEIHRNSLKCISSLTTASKNDSEHNLIKLILEKRLPIAVLDCLKHNDGPFVKPNALECLEKMVSILDIWEGSLKESDLISHCLNLMQYESVGMIRRQIVKLITALFTNNKLSDELFNEICTVMVHVSIKDPLCEVKTLSYEFWDSVVQKFIRTSCELNDIETLNDNFVKLSCSGCLHVLYVALKEEHDLVVKKKAICLTKKLLVYISSTNNFTEYSFNLKIESINCPSSVDENLENCNGSKNEKSRQIDSSDRILNTIMTTNDCEFVNPSLKFTNNSNIYPNEVCLRKKTDVYVSINDFLNFASTYNFNDCDALTQWDITTKSELDSVLDDIINQSQNGCIKGADLVDCQRSMFTRVLCYQP